jgi:hypothetical protein
VKKTLLLAAVAALALGASPSVATTNPNDPGPLPGCSPSGQTPQKCDEPTTPPVIVDGGDGGAGGAGGDGGTGVGVGVGVGVGIGEGGNVTVGDTTLTNTLTGTQTTNVTTGDVTNTATGGTSTSTATGGSVGDTTATGGTVGDISVGGSSATIAEGAVTNTVTGGTGGAVHVAEGAVTSDNSNENSNVNDNASTATSSVAGSGNSTNSNTASAGNNSGNSSVNVSHSNVSNYRRAHRTVATAYAPTVVGAGGNDSCLGSSSGGAQTGLFGISLGGTRKDVACQRIKYSRRAEELGLPDVACRVLANDVEFARALIAAGRDCSMQQFQARMLPVQQTIPVGDAIIPLPQPTPVQVPTYNPGERG